MKFPFDLRVDAAFDVVGFGTNAVDHLIRVPEIPELGGKTEFTDYSIMPGGEVASTMVGLKRLGATVAYAGRFGADREGEIGLRSLIEESVDTEFAETIGNARTQVAFIAIDERSGERTILWQRDAALAYTADEAPTPAAARCRILHMTPHDTAACIEMATAARQHGVIVSLDIDNVFEDVERLLPKVDICIASAEFPGKLTGILDTGIALREISSRFGCAVTGTTLGRKGSIVICGGAFTEARGYDVPGGCIDTTGAGDAYRTGFLFGILKGRPIEECSAMANAVAALKCRGIGARAALPTEDELSLFMANA